MTKNKDIPELLAINENSHSNQNISITNIEILKPEYIEQLQNKTNILNNTYTQKLSQLQLLQAQNDNILKQLNCNTIEEAIELKNQIEQELLLLIPETENYINQIESSITEIDKILIQ